jgi:hypothetical protein
MADHADCSGRGCGYTISHGAIVGFRFESNSVHAAGTRTALAKIVVGHSKTGV